MATRLLLQSKDAKIRELERYFGMVQYIIDYYKNEHKYMKKMKRDLGLQKKMAKHYARRNQVAREKLKEALTEIQSLKEGKNQANLELLAQYSQQVPQTPRGRHPPNLRRFGQVFVFWDFEGLLA